jgi:hypothetical protein
MTDLRFFLKAVELLLAFLYLWFITSVMTAQLWLWPILFVGLCLFVAPIAIWDERKKRKENNRAIGRERQRIAKEKQRQTEERLVSECRAVAAAEAGLCVELTDDAIAMFCSPN